MKRISTHVLDVHRGKPASGVAVRLERQEAGGWQLLKSALTDQDGRCSQLLNGDELPAGLYRVVFDTASYFDALQVETLYSNIEVSFRVREGESQFHLPLLLNANGYTTYRGS
jgi:5-hydroxyisourate hydrolase